MTKQKLSLISVNICVDEICRPSGEEMYFNTFNNSRELSQKCIEISENHCCLFPLPTLFCVKILGLCIKYSVIELLSDVYTISF